MSISEYDDLVSRLLNAYVLGDMLLVTRFCNAITDEMVVFIDATRFLPTLGQIHEVWERVPHGSKFARLWVDYITVETIPEHFEKQVEGYPPEFVVEIAKVCKKEEEMALELRAPGNRPKCFYHEHKDDEDKCA